jgi:ABC-type multidrug transport system fused ATPase/permease subunit
MRCLRRLNEKIFFANLTPVLKLGMKRSLQPADLPPLPAYLDPEAAAIDETKIEWRSGKGLLWSLLRQTRAFWLRGFAFFALFGAMNLLGPVLVNLFVSHISSGLEGDGRMIWGITYGAGVGLVGIVGGLAIQHYFLRNLAWNQIVTNVVNTKLFRHSLNLSKEARDATPVGDIVNHMSADTESVAEFGGAVADGVYTVMMLAGAIGLLFHYLGATAWVAVVLLLVLAPVTRKVGRDFTRFDEDLMRWRDQRVSLMSQILSAIRLVKYFAWEDSVALEVAAIRAKELESRRRIARASLLVTVLYVSVGTFVLFAVLAVHSWRGGPFSAALLFTCVSLFALLEDPFATLSRVVSQTIAAFVGAGRIAKFLQLETVKGRASAVNSEMGEAAGLAVRGLRVELPGLRQAVLRDLNIRIEPGESLAVIGGVGSGKSTLINAILGEVPWTAGAIKFLSPSGAEMESCRTSLVSQEAYILNGTLRANLTFGADRPLSDADCLRALQLAGMAADVALMPGGLNTEIGEKGINLSGGQRQRLSLARAVLHRPQLVILDDPLSALDPATERAVAADLLFGEWRGVTRVMITHRLNHLEAFDRIAFLDNGELVAFGTYRELFAHSGEFQAYMSEHAKSEAHAAAVHHSAGGAVAAPIAAVGEAVRVTEEEDRHFGAVTGHMYRDYISSLGGENRRLRPLVLFGLLAAAVSPTALPLLQKSWLAFTANVQSGGGEGWDWLRGLAVQPMNAVYVYGLLGILVLAGAMAADLFWLRQGLAAGRLLHERMLKSVLGARIRFFDSTPVGRALQRFSRDMEAIDIHLQWSFEHSVKCFAQVALTLVLIVGMLPFVLVVFVPVLAVYYRIQKLYRASAREVKRLDSISRSPRFAHFKETLQGLVVIRAYGKGDWFLREFYARLRHSQRMFYGHYMINRWFSTRIPVVGGIVAMATTLSIVVALRYGRISSGAAGLLTVYSLSFWGVLNWGIRIWAEVEARMTSMERVRHFINLPQEQNFAVRGAERAPPEPPAEWPQAGEIRFENVRARYAPHMPLVLQGLNFHIAGGSWAGIVGRTGSGKSTIFQVLYRLLELEEGRVLIDGVDIAGVPLNRLRRALAIIPQDPTLFMGSLRANLDRYNQYADGELWRVLERTSLADFVRGLPKGLDTPLVENGVNLSQGQRQLLCLARALLLKAKIIILDEATASVDVKTDATVQRVLRESGSGITMLIIAHRLGTVQDCNQIINIAAGRAVAEPAAAETEIERSPVLLETDAGENIARRSLT